MKKVLATILALVMALGVTTAAWADTTVEASTSELTTTGTYVLTADVTLTGGKLTIAENADVTLDLGTFKLTGSIVNKGKLKVIGTGSVVATAAGTAAVANFPGGTVTLSGGTYESANWYVIKNMGEMYINGSVNVQKPQGSTDTSSLIDNGWYGSTDTVAGEQVPARANAAKLVISSGNFNGKSGAKSCSVVKNDDYGVLEISGGTFDSTANNGTDNAATLLNWNVATISGGTFKGMYPISNGAYAAEADKGQITITGGEFIGTSTIFGMGVGGNAKGSVTVSGGTFTAPALGAGYENVDGGYTLTVTGGTFSSDVSAYAPEGTPVAIVGSEGYAVGSSAISAAANGGKDVTVVKAGPITGVDAGKSILVGRDVTGVTINGNTVTAGTSYTVPARYYYYNSTTTDTKATDTKGSPKTFDAGIALYVGMALTSAAGVAFVGKKRED
ncbi:MAG: carbohydrate-binding domain-containing protein [Firmicutes bacterium]|nr:carbohydrate-binding domain-containing protein [Bacillota bacterium]